MPNLNSFQIPDINRPGLSTEEQVKILRNALISLQDQLTYILTTNEQIDYTDQFAYIQQQIDLQQEAILQIAKALKDLTDSATSGIQDNSDAIDTINDTLDTHGSAITQLTTTLNDHIGEVG